MEILDRFCQEMRGSNPVIGIIPTASSEPEEIGKDYLEAFQKLGMSNMQVIPIASRADSNNADYCKIIEQVDGILFTGGDQLKLTSLLGGTRFMQILKERYTYDNIVIAGTSAGAAVLSTPMIYSGPSDGGFRKGDVYITTGLEFMRDVAIDTHFISRGRISRMAQAIATNPQCIGIGLEEDTAILFTEGKYMEVLGSGLIVVVDGMHMEYTNIHEIEPGVPVSVKGLRVHMLGKGERYTLPTYDQQHR
jgi:cyanophycinase